MTWLMWSGLVLGLLALGVIGVAAMAILGARRWSRATAALGARLDASRVDAKLQPPSPARYDPRELDGLPKPVQRYFRAVLTDGQSIINAATVDLTGRFNMSPTGQRWIPFTSRQRVVTRRPGFMWDARMAMVPGMPVRVVDSYIAGEGALRAAILGLFTVAEQQGGREMDRGEFIRWFAEAPWYPTALLPSQGVRWAAVDDRSADASVTDGPHTLTLRFRFDEGGLIESARAEARGATVGKDVVLLPWEGRWTAYQVRDGMNVPLTGEAAWMHPQGRRPYFVGTVTALAYEYRQ